MGVTVPDMAATEGGDGPEMHGLAVAYFRRNQIHLTVVTQP
jgi:hypothetical protein